MDAVATIRHSEYTSALVVVCQGLGKEQLSAFHAVVGCEISYLAISRPHKGRFEAESVGCQPSALTILEYPIHMRELSQFFCSRMCWLMGGIQPVQTPSTSMDVADKGKCHALIVDDNTINRMMLGRVLATHGMEVTLAEDGRMAVDTYTANPLAFDVVLMDVQMPIMNGLEATKAIRMYEATHVEAGHVQIIAHTAHVLKTDRCKCIDVGMDGYIQKPCPSAVLISSLLDAASLRRKSLPR